MKTALVVSGGGCKGAFAVGAIEWLLELDLQFDIIVGTSTGALIAPLIAARRFSTLYNIYSNVTTKQIIKPYCWLTLPWRSALYNDRGLRRIINHNYTAEVHQRLNDIDTEVRVCTVSLNTGGVCYWDPKQHDRPTFTRALSASSNQPGLMRPVQVLKGEDYHVDGGVREIAPIQKAVELGARRIIAIVLEREDVAMAPGKFTRIPTVLLRTLSLMFTETRKNDIDIVRKMPSVDLTVIRPKTHLTDNDLEFKPEIMRQMIKKGYKRAKHVIPTT
jgi:predicted acylesterase/phospholipase RssA